MTPVTTNLFDQTENEESESVIPPDILQLNVGGALFRLRVSTIQKRGEVGLLHKFIKLSHKGRLKYCNDYIERTGDYFFERSARLFEPIYHYYVSGSCYRPSCIPEDVFNSELVFWGLFKVFFPNSPFPENLDPDDTPEVDPFKFIFMGEVRRKIWNLCEVPESSLAARLFAATSILAVFISNLGLVLASLPQFQVNSTRVKSNGTNVVYWTDPHPTLEHIELGCIAFFTVEYLSKMIVAPNRRQVFFKFMNMIDLIAILPFYLEVSLTIIGFDTAQMEDFQGALLVVRILRVLRVIRLLKLGRYSTGLQMFVKVIQRSLAQLGMVLAVVGIGVMFFSTLVYFTEKDHEGTKFTSIPASFWWCIVTVTTVGYGDMYPETVGGKLVASVAIACGVLVLSLPITVIVDSFMQVQEEFNAKREAQKPAIQRKGATRGSKRNKYKENNTEFH